jgi:hypothetical protein
MRIASTVFSKAVTLVEFRQSGNPQEKYKAGRGLLSTFVDEAMKSGSYISYMEQVLSETSSRLNELEKEIETYDKATFTMSLELRDPEAYRQMRLQEELEEGEYL